MMTLDDVVSGPKFTKKRKSIRHLKELCDFFRKKILFVQRKEAKLRAKAERKAKKRAMKLEQRQQQRETERKRQRDEQQQHQSTSTSTTTTTTTTPIDNRKRQSDVRSINIF